MITTKSLYSQIVSLIEQRAIRYAATTSKVDRVTSISDKDLGAFVSTATTEDVVSAISGLLSHIVEPRVISGLEVIATNPPSNSIIVKAGEATGAGKYFVLDNDVILPVNLSSGNSVYYVNVYSYGVKLENKLGENGVTVAKIVNSNPSRSNVVVDSPDSWGNSYIQSFKKYNLYGMSDKFEEDTIELLRNNIGEVLADNLIGNIKLSENLKVTNVAGTLTLDSNSVKMFSSDNKVLAKFDKSGTYFYNDDGTEIARFSVYGASVGNILVTPNSIQSKNYISGNLGRGFQILDNGEAEFNNIKIRGKLTSSVFEKETVSSIGGNLLVSDSDILNKDMTSKSNSTITITGDTVFVNGDILRIKDGVDDEWFEVIDAFSAPTYVVTRDKANSYSGGTLPAWKKGIAVINYGSSGQGLIYMTASETNAPYFSVVTHNGSPWTGPTTRVRIGNLNGFLGYITNRYGIGIGDSNSYLTYDPVDGLQIKGSITITGGTHIPVTYYQPTEPNGVTLYNGDYWVDTSSGDIIHIYQNSQWNPVGTAAVGGGITTFRQSNASGGEGIPTSLNVGDLWINTGDDNKLYRAAEVGASTIGSGNSGWVLVRDASSETVDDWRSTTDTTKIDGGHIQTGSISADKIQVCCLESISANMGTLTSGTLCSGVVCGSAIYGTDIVGSSISGTDIFGSTICGTDITGSTITGACVQSGADYPRTVFDAYSIRSYNEAGVEQVSIEKGCIKLTDAECDCNYTYVNSGKLMYNDVMGQTAYIKRLCSGVACTGGTVILPGWTMEPKVQVGIAYMQSFNSSKTNECQSLHIYHDTPTFYCVSECNYGYCFGVHASLITSGGTGNTLNIDVNFGQCFTTSSAVCFIQLGNTFQVWANDASSNYCAGCLCYRVCYRCNGCNVWCYCDFNYLQSYGSVGELKSCRTVYANMTFPCGACWQLMVTCTGVSWVNTGIPAGTVCCKTCTRSLASAFTNCLCCGVNCCIWAYGTWSGVAPANVFCSTITYTWNGCHWNLYSTGSIGTKLIFGGKVANECTYSKAGGCSFGPATLSYDYGYGDASASTTGIVIHQTRPFEWGSACVSVTSATLYQCYCCVTGSAGGCSYYLVKTKQETYTSQCNLDVSGCLYWLAISYD